MRCALCGRAAVLGGDYAVVRRGGFLGLVYLGLCPQCLSQRGHRRLRRPLVWLLLLFLLSAAGLAACVLWNGGTALTGAAAGAALVTGLLCLRQYWRALRFGQALRQAGRTRDYRGVGGHELLLTTLPLSGAQTLLHGESALSVIEKGGDLLEVLAHPRRTATLECLGFRYLGVRDFFLPGKLDLTGRKLLLCYLALKTASLSGVRDERSLREIQRLLQYFNAADFWQFLEVAEAEGAERERQDTAWQSEADEIRRFMARYEKGGR